MHNYLEQTTLLPKAKEALELGSEIADIGIVTTKGGNLLRFYLIIWELKIL